MRTAYLTALIIAATASSTFAAPIPDLSTVEAREKPRKFNLVNASSAEPRVQPPQRANSDGHSVPATSHARLEGSAPPPKLESPAPPQQLSSPTPSSHDFAAPEKPTADQDRNYRLRQIQTRIQATSLRLAQTDPSQWANVGHTAQNEEKDKQVAAAAAKSKRRAFHEEYYAAY